MIAVDVPELLLQAVAESRAPASVLVAFVRAMPRRDDTITAVKLGDEMARAPYLLNRTKTRRLLQQLGVLQFKRMDVHRVAFAIRGQKYFRAYIPKVSEGLASDIQLMTYPITLDGNQVVLCPPQQKLAEPSGLKAGAVERRASMLAVKRKDRYGQRPSRHSNETLGLVRRAAVNILADALRKTAPPVRIPPQQTPAEYFEKFLDLVRSGKPIPEGNDMEAAKIILAANTMLAQVCDLNSSNYDSRELTSIHSTLQWLRTEVLGPLDNYPPIRKLQQQFRNRAGRGLAQMLLELTFALRTKHHWQKFIRVNDFFQPGYGAPIFRQGMEALIKAESDNPGEPRPNDGRGAVTLRGVMRIMCHEYEYPNYPFPGAPDAEGRITELAREEELAKIPPPPPPPPPPTREERIETALTKRAALIATDPTKEAAEHFRFCPGETDDEAETRFFKLYNSKDNPGENIRRWSLAVIWLDVELWNLDYDIRSLPKISAMFEKSFHDLGDDFNKEFASMIFYQCNLFTRGADWKYEYLDLDLYNSHYINKRLPKERKKVA